MRIPRIAAAVALAMLLSGCPAPSTTITRSAELGAVPDVYCVVDRLKEVASGRAVTYTTEEMDAGTRHSYLFLISANYYSWGIFVKPDRTSSISSGTSIGDSYPEMLPVVRDRLLKVELALRNQCGLGNVMDAAKEECRGKACPVP